MATWAVRCEARRAVHANSRHLTHYPKSPSFRSGCWRHDAQRNAFYQFLSFLLARYATSASHFSPDIASMGARAVAIFTYSGVCTETMI